MPDRSSLIFAVLALLTLAVCSYFLSSLPFLRTTVYNVSDPAAFAAPSLPGFIQQKPDAPRLIAFRQYVAPSLNPGDDETAKIVAIQHWVRRLEGDNQFYYARGPMTDGTEDPQIYLEQQRLGQRSACRRFSYILCGALLSAGFNARLVSVANRIDRDTRLAHNLVEVWMESRHKWIMLDPTFDAFVLVNGVPASLIEVHDAAQLGPRSGISLDQHGWRYRIPPVSEYQSYFRHSYVARTNAVFDGYRYALVGPKRIEFVHYAGPGVEPYPQLRKDLLLLALAVAVGLVIVVGLRYVTRLVLLLVRKMRTPRQSAVVPLRWPARVAMSHGLAARRVRLPTFSIRIRPLRLVTGGTSRKVLRWPADLRGVPPFLRNNTIRQKRSAVENSS